LVYESARNGWVTVKHAPKDLNTFQGSVSGFIAGGSVPPRTTDIQKFSFASENNAVSTGDLVTERNEGTNGAGPSSNESGYVAAGSDNDPATGLLNSIEKFPFAISDGQSGSDVGDLTQGRRQASGHSSSVSGYVSGGDLDPSVSNVIDKFPFATDSNATDVGDLARAGNEVTGCSSTSNGYTLGGYTPPQTYTNDIQKFPFANDTNATDVASLSRAVVQSGGHSSVDFGYCSGGVYAPDNNPPATDSNRIDKFPFATDNNATDIADLQDATRLHAVSDSIDFGYDCGGFTTSGAPNRNKIQKFSFQSDANGTDVSDLATDRFQSAGHQN